MAKSRKEAAAPNAPLEPRIGDRVSISSFDTVYIITRASIDNVDLNLPGANIERFRVPTQDLRFVDLAPRPPAKPAKPTINLEEVRERLATAQHASMDQLSGDIAILKKYLKSKGIDSGVLEDLDRLCKDTEESWRTAVAKITEMLEE